MNEATAWPIHSLAWIPPSTHIAGALPQPPMLLQTCSGCILDFWAMCPKQGCLKEKRLLVTSLKQICNECLILRIRAHLSWRTGKHLHVLHVFHVLRTYSTCSYPGYQDTTTYAALVPRPLSFVKSLGPISKHLRCSYPID